MKNEKDELVKFSDFEKNKENPFLKQAIQEINESIVKKYKSASGTDQRAILQAYDPNTGETLGHTSFIRQIEVDEQEFVKFYLRDFKAFYGLTEKAFRIFGYILTKLIPNRDEFIFLLEECMNFTTYQSKRPIYAGLTELIQAEIIARGRTEVFYYINPMVIFNGNRVTFTKTYVKKSVARSLKDQQREIANQSQLNIFEENESL